jgi:hypothetical protein
MAGWSMLKIHRPALNMCFGVLAQLGSAAQLEMAEALLTPLLAAHPMVCSEQPIRIVATLHRR